MVYAFDSLAYAKRLRDAGVDAKQAEAHAESARDFVMGELVTRHDLEVVRRELDTSIAAVRGDLDTTRRELDTSIAAARRDTESAIDRQTLRLTVRLGGIVAIGVAALATIIKL
ncbi:MAG: hypothetical protein BGP12_06850 [Rhodospirillales bacterium 70-18]|nr:MAG: hypothetical protein BGP12_06850 [Rhodospirillales bacterium 70-18]